MSGGEPREVQDKVTLIPIATLTDGDGGSIIGAAV